MAKYGPEFYADNGVGGHGVTEAAIEALFDALMGLKLKRFFDLYVRGTDDLLLEKLLASAGLKITDLGAPPRVVVLIANW